MSNIPSGMSEIDRLVRESAARLSEHVDSVQIFVSKQKDDGSQGTWHMSFGAGNWFSRYGQVRQWLEIEDEASRKEAAE